MGQLAPSRASVAWKMLLPSLFSCGDRLDGDAKAEGRESAHKPCSEGRQALADRRPRVGHISGRL